MVLVEQLIPGKLYQFTFTTGYGGDTKDIPFLRRYVWKTLQATTPNDQPLASITEDDPFILLEICEISGKYNGTTPPARRIDARILTSTGMIGYSSFWTTELTLCQ